MFTEFLFIVNKTVTSYSFILATATSYLDMVSIYAFIFELYTGLYLFFGVGRLKRGIGRSFVIYKILFIANRHFLTFV